MQAAGLVILLVVMVTLAVVWGRAEQIVEPTALITRGLIAVRAELALIYGVGGVLAGLIFARIYFGVARRWPGSAPRIYLILGISLAALLDLAAVVWTPDKASAYIILNWGWALGYGGLLPLLIRLIGHPPAEAAPWQPDGQTPQRARL
jgi:hypothetical protein